MNGDPFAEEPTHFTEVEVDRDDILKSFETWVVDRYIIPGRPKIVPQHRMTEHEEVMESVAKIVCTNNLGERVYRDSSSNVSRAKQRKAEDGEDDNNEILGIPMAPAAADWSDKLRKAARKVYGWITTGASQNLLLGRIVAIPWRAARKEVFITSGAHWDRKMRLYHSIGLGREYLAVMAVRGDLGTLITKEVSRQLQEAEDLRDKKDSLWSPYIDAGGGALDDGAAACFRTESRSGAMGKRLLIEEEQQFPAKVFEILGARTEDGSLFCFEEQSILRT
jgi:hypothetical protein